MLEDISWGGHFKSNNAAPKMEGPRAFPGGEWPKLRFFSNTQTQISFKPPP
jgi:hypothetical protein